MSNIIPLNIASLGDEVIIKKGGGGATINNQDKVVDITENGTTEVVADSEFTGLGKVTINTEVSGGGTPTPSKPKYTGHADVEGLKAIGWTDEDIAYYQENGVNWNEEDDEWHKVSDDNKALYGVLTADNISTYKDRIVYLPKIDTSKVTDMSTMFEYCCSLISIPQLDTTNVTKMYRTFYNCYSLTSIPQLDTSNVNGTFAMEGTFYNCCSLTSIPQLDTSKVMSMNEMFCKCYSLTSIPQLDTSKVTAMYRMFEYCHSLISIPQLDTTNVTRVNTMFEYCYSLISIPMLDTSKVTDMSTMFSSCHSLTHAYLKNVKSALNLSNANLLSKDSLLYLINNEAATSAITIKLASYAYDRWATDPDVVNALANHPNISISK